MSHPPQPITRTLAPFRLLSRRLRRLGRSDRAARIIARGATAYFRFVGLTSTMTYEADNPFAVHRDQLPLIAAIWHGHQFPLPFIRPPDQPVRVLISKHRDGSILAALAKNFGVQAIRGSGGRDRVRWAEKGAVGGFFRLRASLDEGYTICMTADISNATSRRAGLGIITLARASGRPIVGIGLASSRRIVIDSWDHAVINLPFSRMACVVTPVIEVPREADDSALEEKRRELEDALNAATDRAYEIVDRRPA